MGKARFIQPRRVTSPQEVHEILAGTDFPPRLVPWNPLKNESLAGRRMEAPDIVREVRTLRGGGAKDGQVVTRS